MARSRTRRDEFLDDLEVDVGLEEGESDLAHRGVHVGLADPAAAGQAAEGRAQALAEGVEHGGGRDSVGGARVADAPGLGECSAGSPGSALATDGPGARTLRVPCATRSPPRSGSNHAFVRVWTAFTISLFGSLITRIALPLVAILTLGAGPIEVAVLRGVELGALMLVGLVAGAWVDRLRRRPVLIWTDLGRAVLLGSIPVAFVLGVLTFWHLVIVAGARRGPDRVLRCGRQRVPADDRRARPARGGQQRPRGQRVRRRVRRLRDQRLPRPGPDRGRSRSSSTRSATSSRRSCC